MPPLQWGHSIGTRQAQAQTTLNETRANLDRVQELERRGIASRGAFDTASAAFDRAIAALNIAVADMRVATAYLRVNQAKFEMACICSPVAGLVLDRDLDVGQTVASSLQSTLQFTLADDFRKMELRVAVDEANIGAVNVRDPVTFTVEAYQARDFPIKISALRYFTLNN